MAWIVIAVAGAASNTSGFKSWDVVSSLVEGRRQLPGAGDPVPALDWRELEQACKVYGLWFGLDLLLRRQEWQGLSE